MLRDEFLLTTKRLLCERAMQRFSMPGCGVLTAGPPSEGRVANISCAAHKTAAQSGGARYGKTLSRRQRRSYENGIWLCQTHAELVDSDHSRDTAPLLRHWRTQREHKVELELHGLNVGPGVLIELGLRGLGRFERTALLRLRNLTVVRGGNLTRKALIAAALRALQDTTALTAWSRSDEFSSELLSADNQ